MRLRVVVPLIATLATCGIVLAGSGNTTMVSASQSYVVGYGSYRFTVKGGPIDTLYPGATEHSRLTLVNPHPFPLVVTDLSGEVVGSSRQRCRPHRSNVRIGRYSGRLPVTIPAKGRTVAGSLPVVMPHVASPDCARTTFVIQLSGTATRKR